MATEALRRLREEIDAAFEVQRRPYNERRVDSTSLEVSTPKWAEVTALLASVGHPTPKQSITGVAGQVSTSLRPVRDISRREKLRQLTASERQALMRKFMIEWRRIAHASAVVTRLHIRAQRRRKQHVLGMIFTAWRQNTVYKLRLKTAASIVTKRAKCKELEALWGRWTSAHRFAVRLREFRLKRHRRLTCEAFCTWVLAATQRARFRRYKQKASRQLLWRYWRCLKAAIKTQRMIHCEVKYFIARRILELKERWFILWIEYIEQRKQLRFAVGWSERRILGDAFDNWREIHENTRRVRHALQLATRRRRRCKIREMLKIWRVFIQNSQKQRHQLAAVLHTQYRRQAFTSLVLHTQLGRERERSLQDWKVRRTVWTWLHHSHRDRMLRLRAEFLKENHDRLVLRTAAWRPWRRNFQRSVGIQEFKAKQRVKRLRKWWMAFVLAANQQNQQRLFAESILDKREVRKIRQALGVWQTRTRSSCEFKALVAKSAVFCRQLLLKRVMRDWKTAYQLAFKKEYLDAKAVRHLASKMLKHWARWAYWSCRELEKRIALVKEQRQQKQIQQCISRWKEMVNARHIALYSKYFTAWKLWTDIQHRQRHLLELRRLIHLRWRWQRWELLALQCQSLRAQASEAQKLREHRLLKHCFATVWLRKTRRYKLGSTILAALSKQHILECAISRWRQNQLRLNAVRLASQFYRKKLQSQYLRLLFERTVGCKRTAIAYYRRRRILRSWSCWNQYFTLRRRRCEADEYFQCRSKQKALTLLHKSAESSTRRRSQRLDAEAWYDAVLLHNFLSKWFAAAKRAQYCRYLGERLAWNGIGRRAFRVWQDGFTEKQKMLSAAEFHCSVLVTRSWNALLRVTKRRQVALAMWRHTMTKTCLSHAFTNWKHFLDNRHGQYAVAATMNRMLEQRIVQRFFSAWSLLGTTRAMAFRREQRELQRWRRRCWSHWKIWHLSCRWQRSQQIILLQTIFSQGLKRYAIQQQACREVCLRTARNVLHRSLSQWRVELWLVRNQKKLTLEAERNALTHWKAFVAACRQKRRWEHYVQQLHRSQTRSKAITLDQKRQVGGTFRHSRALQAQLKRNRILMTHVLHAWYLAVQNRRRRSLKRLHRSRPISKARQIALEFWARRVMDKCFLIWREQSLGKLAEMA
ncbi:hypothetical protein L914_12559 [Phytophthora nicotianae]|uniref:Sfi1 spindle body domain-containing protein n=1 Tax=Phytophthora nicotianae TaxID=4792 RepID=W2N1D3_PHYNI|nr:hypothetical protein L914_12559 [Phytophthora nicotianae]